MGSVAVTFTQLFTIELFLEELDVIRKDALFSNANFDIIMHFSHKFKSLGTRLLFCHIFVFLSIFFSFTLTLIRKHFNVALVFVFPTSFICFIEIDHLSFTLQYLTNQIVFFIPVWYKKTILRQEFWKS